MKFTFERRKKMTIIQSIESSLNCIATELKWIIDWMDTNGPLLNRLDSIDINIGAIIGRMEMRDLADGTAEKAKEALEKRQKALRNRNEALQKIDIEQMCLSKEEAEKPTPQQ